MGYFWFGEDTFEDWVSQNALEAATYGAAWYMLSHPKETARALKPVAGLGIRFGWTAGKYGVRVTWAGGAAALNQPIIRGVTAGHVLTGYGIGAVVGTGIAYAGWGKKGALDAIDLYTGGVSWGKYMDTVGGAIDKTLF